MTGLFWFGEVMPKCRLVLFLDTASFGLPENCNASNLACLAFMQVQYFVYKPREKYDYLPD